MRRVLRKLLAVGTAISFLLCAATCALWWWSYRSLDDLNFARAGGRFWHVSNDAGAIDFDWFGPYPEDEPLSRRAYDQPVTAGTVRLRPFLLGGVTSRRKSLGVTLATGTVALTFSPADGRVCWKGELERDERIARQWAVEGQWLERRGVVIVTGPLPQSSPMRYTWVRVPHWMLALLTSLLPVMMFAVAMIRSLRKGRRAAAGQCPVCSYDLRATPERCPECGAVPSEAKA